MSLESKVFSVKPKNFDNSDLIQQEYFTKLDNYDMSFVKERLFIEKTFADEKEYTEASCELKKFFALSKLYGQSMAMTSPRIDEVWHQFILFTRDYHKFCDDFIGRYFHHDPNIPSRMNNSAIHESYHNFINAYTQTYGDIPSIWGIIQNNKETKIGGKK